MSRFKLGLIVAAMMVALGVVAPTPANGAATANEEHGPRPSRYILPGAAVFPEGIAYQKSTGNFFVSSTTDGAIFRGNVREEMTQVFLPGGADGRTTATGMKVDRRGRLFISGGSSGRVFVYDAGSGALLGAFSDGQTNTFVNDVAVTRDGTAYFTDSLSPFLYRVSTGQNGQLTFETWLDFTGTVVQYQPGFNLNGIAATPDGQYLIVVQSNTGKLFRITIPTKEVVEIDLGGATLTNGDGILLRGRTLYVVRNQQALIVKVRLSGDLTHGSVVSSTTDPSLAFPTTIALARGRLLVVNSQFDKRGPGLTPVLPFTVSSIRVP